MKEKTEGEQDVNQQELRGEPASPERVSPSPRCPSTELLRAFPTQRVFQSPTFHLPDLL